MLFFYLWYFWKGNDQNSTISRYIFEAIIDKSFYVFLYTKLSALFNAVLTLKLVKLRPQNLRSELWELSFKRWLDLCQLRASDLGVGNFLPTTTPPLNVQITLLPEFSLLRLILLIDLSCHFVCISFFAWGSSIFLSCARMHALAFASGFCFHATLASNTRTTYIQQNNISCSRPTISVNSARARVGNALFALHMRDAPVGVRTCCCCRRQRPRAPKTCLSPAPENCAIFDRRRTPRRRAPSLFLRSVGCGEPQRARESKSGLSLR